MPKPAEEDPRLPVTPRKESAKGDDQPSTFTVAQRWFAEQRLKALLIAIAILSPLLSLWYVNRIVSASRAEMWAWNMDSGGVLTYAPLEIVNPDSKVFREIILQAGEVYMKRNPAGLSNDELLPRYFSAAAVRAVRAEVTQTLGERSRRNLFDQPEFTKQPERLDASGGSYRYRVVGYILRSGIIDGMAERDIGDFRIGIELEPSDSVRDKGRFPFVVKQYKCVITWRSNGQVEEFSSAAGGKVQGAK